MGLVSCVVQTGDLLETETRWIEERGNCWRVDGRVVRNLEISSKSGVDLGHGLVLRDVEETW